MFIYVSKEKISYIEIYFVVSLLPKDFLIRYMHDHFRRKKVGWNCPWPPSLSFENASVPLTEHHSQLKRNEKPLKSWRQQYMNWFTSSRLICHSKKGAFPANNGSFWAHQSWDPPQDTIVWCACFNLKIAVLMFSKNCLLCHKLHTSVRTFQSFTPPLLWTTNTLSALHKAHKIFMSPLLWHSTTRNLLL